MSDTPRTDRYEDGRIGSPLDLSEYEGVLQFARTLERENAELVAALKHCLDAGLFPSARISTAYNDATALLAKLGEK